MPEDVKQNSNAEPALSQRVLSVGTSPTSRAAGAALSAVDARAPIDLGAGCPDWAPPPGTLDAARFALTTSMGYGRPGGDPDLLAAIASAYGRSIDHGPAVATCGGKEAVFLALGALLDPGDPVVVCTPCWPSFIDQIRAWGGHVRRVPPGIDGRPSLEALDEACRGAKVIIVNTPGNPSGLHWSAEAAQIAGAAAVRDGAGLLIDSVYEQLAYAPAPVDGRWFLERYPDHALVVDAASKRLAMPGLRLGWAIGAPHWIDGIRRLQDASTTHPSRPSQAAGLAGLRAEADWLPDIRARLQSRAHAVVEAVGATTGLSLHRPQGGLFALVQLPKTIDDVKLQQKLIASYALKVVPGAAFHASGTLRLALRVGEADVKEAVARIAAAVTDG